MEKISGKEAWVALAEIETGNRKVNDQEIAYVNKQCRSFARWLLLQGRTKSEATTICQTIYDRTIQLLNEDTYNDFIWSRIGGVSKAEIDLISMFDEDTEAARDEEYLMFERYWKDINDEKSIPRTNEAGFMGYDPIHWRRISERVQPIYRVLDHYEEHVEHNPLEPKQIASLRNLKDHTRKLRFGISKGWKNKKIRSLYGDGIYISNTIWKKVTNRINTLLGIDKQYNLPEPKVITEQQDVMDNNPIYGFDMERM